MSEDRIRDDLAFLAGNLPHRRANSENERTAAEYVADRFKEYTPDTEVDDFYSPDDPWYLFASYYAEFCVVSIIAIWWPRIALCYGAAVFLAYLAEFMGHHVMSRLVPQYETQNVVARFLSPRPKRLFVITAHYDSGKICSLVRPRTVSWLGVAHSLVLLCMLTVLMMCAFQALGIFDEAPMRYDVIARWTAAGCLLGAAAILFYCDATGEPTRGANDNASGVAALLGLAERLADEPLKEADVCLVATGSHTSWMNGIRHLIKTHAFDRENTYFLNIDCVGAGDLRYATAEGMLHLFPCSAEMIEAAGAVAPEHGAAPCRLRAACSDSLIPLARGYKAMRITAVEEQDIANETQWRNDTLLNADSALTAKAVDFAEAALRRLEADLS